ncbi:MAG: outer membrane receptor protein involved in Fe transport [Urechidicola sp.]|jgi:outer membrane receptor protein involved in Fe transport
MKNFITTIFALLFTVTIWAQGTLTGTIMDSDQDDALIGATVYLKGTNYGTATDFNGAFEMTDVDAGDYTLVVSYTGYAEMTKDITITDGANDLGSFKLTGNSIGIAEVSVIASIAIDRKTPVAVSTIKGEDIEAKLGNQEFPEILKSTPSVYVTKTGGGFGDARINVRGFDQTNIAVMINGIPVNDMENGRVYWSNWAGLSDVTSNLQVQRGLGASKLAVPSVGGSINIITNAADFEKGGKFSVGVGNDGFQKYGLMLSSGQSEKGFAATAQFTHTRGDGYVDGTKFRAYSYFLSLSQTIGDNQSLSFTMIGAPQWHHQRDGMTSNDDLSVGIFQEDQQGRKFNWNSGTLDGKEFNWRRNFYHKPKAFLNHYWTLGDNTDLKTSAYVSFGRGGGTGGRGYIKKDSTGARIYQSFSGFNTNTHDENGQVKWDDIVSYNTGNEVAAFGSPDTDPLTTSKRGDGFIRRASMNSHNWYGLLSTLTHKFNSQLTLTGGIDVRYYKGIHYRRLENLLGNTSYSSGANNNNPTNTISEVSEANFGNFHDNSYKDGNNVLNYWNDGLVSWTGIFAQLEYSNDKLTAFGSVNGSNQGFKRIDHFNYLDSDPEQESDWQNFLGGNVKAGVNYNIDDHNNVFFNTGFISKQPIFDNVFVNFVNDVNPDAKNQSISSFELGYGYRSQTFRANVNAYYTNWSDRQLNFGTENALTQDLLYNFTTTQIHSGLELEMNWSPTRALTIKGMASIGNWEYGDDFTAVGNNIDSVAFAPEDITIFANGLKVGDAAQTTLNLGINYEIIDGLRVYADYFFNDRLYANFSLDQDDQFQAEGGQVLELPSYSLVDLGASYTFPISDYKMTVRFNVNNLLDEWYVSELTTNGDSVMESQGFVGFGRTWNAGIKFHF